MSQSLQDQLLNAGLVSKSKASKAKKAKHKKVRQQRNTKGSASSEADQQQQKARAEKATKDRLLNERLNETRNRRETTAQVKQLVENNRHPRSSSEDDTAFFFENKGKVKQMYVSAQTQQMITSGKLMIVNCNGVFELVPAVIAEKIRQRNPSLVLEVSKEKSMDEDDPYAEHQVPDDLKW